MKCPCCNHEIPDQDIAKYLAGKGGQSTSDAKRAAAIANGKKSGGRPKKIKEVEHDT